MECVTYIVQVMSTMMSQILKFEDSIKTQKSQYLSNKKIYSLDIKGYYGNMANYYGNMANYC